MGEYPVPAIVVHVTIHDDQVMLENWLGVCLVLWWKGESEAQ